MGSAGARGRTSWVLAGGLLAAALVLPAGAGLRDGVPQGPGPLGPPEAALPTRDLTRAPGGAAPQRPAQIVSTHGGGALELEKLQSGRVAAAARVCAALVPVCVCVCMCPARSRPAQRGDPVRRGCRASRPCRSLSEARDACVPLCSGDPVWEDTEQKAGSPWPAPGLGRLPWAVGSVCARVCARAAQEGRVQKGVSPGARAGE
ncbi:hypothetical protein J0S82_018352 [Galemys pyrenaicus]|uniref:Uncharacterized protein n=1 Tax=Galemys pyrenaicus TaxID=202257 RepID=A0A8J5ZQX3_GALPY|nr:hypothetical protein J0S82_018352 [Galemys pyrenaicus]